MMRALERPSVRAISALGFILLVGVLFNANGAFFEWGTHRDMLRQVSVYGLLACGMTPVIVSGGIDLSVGSLLGLTAVLFSTLTLQRGWPPSVAIPACILAGTALGLVSGGVISRWDLQPFIVTMAMMVFGRGLAKWISGGQKVSSAVLQADGSYQYMDLPRIFGLIDHRILGGNVAVVTVILLVSAGACWLWLSRLRWGRWLYAVGGNEEAARLSGVPTHRVKLLAYGACGALGAVAGICQAAQEQQGDPEAGGGYELMAIAMVVIGGTSLSGGRGGVAYTLLGILTIGYLDKILSLNAVGESSRLMLTGAIIVAAVLLQRTREKK